MITFLGIQNFTYIHLAGDSYSDLTNDFKAVVSAITGCIIWIIICLPVWHWRAYTEDLAGTGRHTQKAQACTRCLPITKEPRN